jgi:hypothetical protein
VVPDIDCARDELATFRVCSCNDEVLAAHHIPLKTCSYEAIDVITDWHEYLACKMSALLSAVKLVFEVDSGRTILGKELRKLDDSRETSVAVSC